jgi:hypothetical protein
MSRDSPAPCGARRSSRDVIEAQITFPHFRQKDDLTGVHREVFDDCVDGSHHRHVVTLDASMFEQSRRIDVREHAIRFRHGCAKLAQELSVIQAALRLELALPLTNVRLSAEAADNPLSNVGIEVEHQIAAAVGFRIGSPPDVLDRQSADCVLDSRHVAVGQQLSGLIDEGLREWVQSVWRFRCEARAGR